MLATMKFAGPELVGLIVAVSFAAGLNVYATVATLGLLARAGVLDLPSGLHLLSNWWVIGASSALFAVEFFADKIPAFDLFWNAPPYLCSSSRGRSYRLRRHLTSFPRKAVAGHARRRRHRSHCPRRQNGGPRSRHALARADFECRPQRRRRCVRHSPDLACHPASHRRRRYRGYTSGSSCDADAMDHSRLEPCAEEFVSSTASGCQ